MSDPRTAAALSSQKQLDADRDRAARILVRHRNLNFVQRLLQAAGKPSYELPNGGGASHYMTSSDNIAYPTIVQLPTGELKYLPGREAYDYARKTGEFIPFKSPEEADWFASNGYKNFYDKKMPLASGPRVPAPPELLDAMGFKRGK